MTLLLLFACSENDLIAKETEPAGDSAELLPAIKVAPRNVDFGTVIFGTSATATVHVRNVGDAALNITDLSVGSADVSFTSLSPVLQPEEAVDTVLTWTPTGPGDLNDSLEVSSNDPDDPVVQVALTGIMTGGDLQITPATYDFGTLTVGETATMSIQVANVGVGPITISDWTYDSADADLRVLDAGGLATMPAVLDAGASTNVVVEYAPSTEGGDEGGLTVSSNDPDSPVIVVTQNGMGAADPCNGYSQHVTILLTADDAWEGWLDGVSFSGPNQNAWNAFDTLSWDLPCGDHTMALYATDVAHAVSGVIAVVWINGVARYVSGPTDWTVYDQQPPAGWQDVTFDDSSWYIPQVCANFTAWGAYPQPFYDQGAQWIWWTPSCSSLGEAWFRLNFNVSP